MPTIRQLSVSIVNKIAAGEVIERPASVVKELLENSIDAGATMIELSVEGGGTDLIRISDNGCGISSNQLELALAPHATSKIESSDDLFDVRSLGFRGEALASIAEISHLTLKSRTADEDAGYELRSQGGEREPIRPCAMPVGTTIEVRHLFFNTPVRRKFMKAPQTEMGHVIEAFTRIALAYPRVHMKLLSNERTLHDMLPTERWADRIRAFFGDEIADGLIAVDHADERVKIRGFVADPSVSRSNNRMQYLFLNGRYIRDRSLQHALGEAYRGLLMVGRMPVCFLIVDVDPKSVDVNVHPTKVEVRFEDSGAIYSRLLHTLRHRFLSSNLVAKVRTDSIPSPRDISPTLAPSLAAATESSGYGSPDLLSWARGTASAASAHSVSHTLGGSPEFRPFPNVHTDPFSNHGNTTSPPSNTLATTIPSAAKPWDVPWRNVDDVSNDPGPPRQVESHGYSQPTGFQIHDRYLVTQDDVGMVIIDQHALHERIMYEQIKSKVTSKSLERQRLLVPETVNLPANECSIAIEMRDVLSDIGLEIEPFGGDTILVTSYPAMLSKFSPSEILRQMLEPLMTGGKKPDAQGLLDELMNMMACKAAVKAGDRLTQPEISALLEQRDLYHDTHHCPHGRPTALFFSREQLDKMFKRI